MGDAGGRGGTGVGRSLVPAPSLAPGDLDGACCRNRTAAPPPLDGRGDRGGGRVQPRDGGPHLGPAGPGALDGADAVPQRYQWARPGQLLHVDTKKLGRIAGIGHRMTGDRRHRHRGSGWEFVHVCVDDCSRLAYAEVLPDERAPTVVAFMGRALQWFRRRGIVAQRVLSDNGNGYRSKLMAAAARAHHLAHRFTRPYTPRTNGKAERFIQTLLREWAYAMAYTSSAHRTAALSRWLHYYNCHRHHSALNGQPPIRRVVGQDVLLRAHN